ncbi:hypothetical protein [Anaerovorax odorimutans]|uniref:hypothetical protein n=1 Tax=Anaerovorax odorimutans TaxID=109327 RepID=UPI000424C1DE|nr:hypothetical protein [Anaerovorax odorimutans]
MRRKKHFMTLVCLIVGMLVLTTTVYANFDDANGYSNYKNALKQLAFEENNFTADYDMTLTIDGKEMMNNIGNYKCSDGNSSSYQKNTDSLNEDDYVWEDCTYREGDKVYNYDIRNNSYYFYNSGNKNGTLIPLDDATSKKAVRFAELLTDTIVGDLKNNVVLESSKDGISNYTINVSGNQIPEIVNAGLSLMFTAGNNNSDYEDEVFSKFGNDPYIDNVNVKVSLDEQGRIVKNSMEATLSGNNHNAVLKANLKVSDYEKTTADIFDPKGKECENGEDTVEITE